MAENIKLLNVIIDAGCNIKCIVLLLSLPHLYN